MKQISTAYIDRQVFGVHSFPKEIWTAARQVTDVSAELSPPPLASEVSVFWPFYTCFIYYRKNERGRERLTEKRREETDGGGERERETVCAYVCV